MSNPGNTYLNNRQGIPNYDYVMAPVPMRRKFFVIEKKRKGGGLNKLIKKAHNLFPDMLVSPPVLMEQFAPVFGLVDVAQVPLQPHMV